MFRALTLTVALLISTLQVCAYQLLEGKLDNSNIYPATIHEFAVSIPDSIFSDRPLCLYVGLDGVLCNAPSRLDSLTATGDVPSMLGVYIQPGVIKDANGEALRYNRSNEFDTIDERFSRFLELELLPAAVQLCADSGFNVRLSDQSRDRMIFGLSSGGIAAFTAAWHRPDLFGKVFSGCGTFVPMRGGDQLQALVRKSEPRDIKVFLQDGFSDTWNPLFGSWYEANAMLGSALEFAGYDCAFDWAEGGHSIARSNEIFDDVMRWLWSDESTEKKAKNTGNTTLSHYLIPQADWKINSKHTEHNDPKLSEADLTEPEVNRFVLGDPVNCQAEYPDGKRIAYVADRSNCLWQCLVDENGERYAAQPFYWLHSYRNAPLTVADMDFDSLGNLWILTDAGLQVCDQNGRVRAIFRLPRDLECAIADGEFQHLNTSRLKITSDFIDIVLPDRSYTRKFNVAPKQMGVLPPSQGQG